MDIKKLLRKKQKTVRIDETQNSVRTLSHETKNDNYESYMKLKHEVFNRRNNEKNDEAPIPEHGIDEIPRLTKGQIKSYRRETLKKVSQNCNKSDSGCTISGGKSRKGRKSRKSRKSRRK